VLMEIKARVRLLGALSLELARTRMAVALGERTPLDSARVADLVMRPKARWRLTPDSRLVTTLDADDRLGACLALLRELLDCASAPASSS